MEESPIPAEADNGGDFSLGPKVTMTFDLGGALSGKQTALAPSLNGKFLKDCAEYSRGTKREDGSTIFAMAGLLDGNVADHKVTVELWIDDYAGPGDYPKDQLVAPGSRPSIAIDNKIYGTWPDSTSSAVKTDGKGGGTWTFKKLATTGEGGLPGDAVTGTIKWTCQNP
ncbi:hypothetical protein [Paractinoplanes lichenicola]|uniref:Uncharacterized protein n=1 Tax=Paractinoplanes lichenicola TaxID=2802976 RepID=A0ABS1VHU2_9ACTN|nr:hypothetical protein [Actinoplanes lichenicola]MBL7254238.1 hypothetical protein [Actinoplanes lichenicola]